MVLPARSKWNIHEVAQGEQLRNEEQGCAGDHLSVERDSLLVEPRKGTLIG
jgi:hypothetical protein